MRRVERDGGSRRDEYRDIYVLSLVMDITCRVFSKVVFIARKMYKL